MNKILNYLIHPYKVLLWLDRHRIITLKDEYVLKKIYKETFNKDLDLNNPILYNEKLQWLKLHDRNPIYSEMVDKYKAKEYVSKIIGKEYIIPCYGVYNSFDEIDFDSLPEKFVIKCTHDSGVVIICNDKKKFDYESAKKKVNKDLKRKYFYIWREWPYKNVKPRIIIEKLLVDKDNDALTDYKFFCFNGEPKIMYISHDAGKNPTTDFFDMNFNHLDIKMKDPNSLKMPDKPEKFEEMIELSKKLSKGIPHLRVDFYLINGKIYFGELTFYHNAGFSHIYPDRWNKQLGDWIKLPK